MCSSVGKSFRILNKAVVSVSVIDVIRLVSSSLAFRKRLGCDAFTFMLLLKARSRSDLESGTFGNFTTPSRNRIDITVLGAKGLIIISDLLADR